MTTLIFDDTGRSWDYASPSLRRELRCPTPDFDLCRYLTDNLGFIALTRLDRVARIKLRPAATSPVALAAALFALADQPPDRLVISYPSSGCGDEVFSHMGRALDRIAEIVADAEEPAGALFFAREQLAEALKDDRSPLSDLLAFWMAAGSTWDLSNQSDFLQISTLGRYMIVDAQDGDLRIAEVGNGFESYGDHWRRHARGSPFEQQPDYAFGVWARGFFEDVLRREQPRSDHSDATIRRPHRNDEIRTRYRRLILPFRQSRQGAVRLLGLSVPDASINLRPEAQPHRVSVAHPSTLLPGVLSRSQARRRTSASDEFARIGVHKHRQNEQ